MGACEHTCDANAFDCDGPGAERICGNFDGDQCREWSAGVPCAPSEACREGRCAAVPPPANVLINEVYANPDGEDAPAAFVELWGPPGTPMAGFELVGINGHDGREYARIALRGAISETGFFVLAHPDANDALRSVSQQLALGANLENGPDSVLLTWGALVLDAIAYGTFDVDEIARGEGDPAGQSAGRSLSRDADHRDTDDNAADFTRRPPSPGAAMPPACDDACTPGARRCVGDLEERCCLADTDCYDWEIAVDCAANGGVCRDGQCDGGVDRCPFPGALQRLDRSVYPSLSTPMGQMTIDAVPLSTRGFAIAAGDLDGMRAL